MDFTCPICLNILFRPVCLPCQHQFCKDCIVQSVDCAAYQCPICRYRLSNWLRKVKDIDLVVSRKTEDEIRNRFPDYYTAREQGISPSSELAVERMSSSNTDPVPDCSAQPGDVHEYYVKEVEKYSRLRSLEDKENEEASLALAAQLLYEDGCSLTDDIPISDEHVDSCHHINNDRYPVLSSSKVRSVAAEHKKKQGNKAPKICKTLLDYAVDTLSAETEPEEQILRDEKFARQLQAQYSRLSDKPIKQTRSRRRK